MTNVPRIEEQIIEGAANILADAGSGSDITNIFSDLGMIDNSGESTKWRRIRYVLCNAQRQDGVAVKFVMFVRKMLSPVRFRNDPNRLKQLIDDINNVLIFAGLKFEENGDFVAIQMAESISDAEKKVSSIRRKLIDRGAHSETLRYCTAELIGNDTFHGVLEACKGLFERIRQMTNLVQDGHRLIDAAFGGEVPILALNSLRTETEKSEQTGFMYLLKGCASACRNPIAHEPRILWAGTDDDALDSLILVSMLHKKLDKCVRTCNRQEIHNEGRNVNF